MEAVKERPPYVSFTFKAVEDRNATIQNGHYTTKDVAFVVITPPGTKDRIERNAEEWLDNCTQAVVEGRMPEAWAEKFKKDYKTWCEGNEPILEGTDVKNWPVLSPSQLQALQQANIRTVEDLANASAEGIARLGMGGLSLKQKAVDWLAAAKDSGQATEEITRLRQALEEEKAKNLKMETALLTLQSQVEALAAHQAQTNVKKTKGDPALSADAAQGAGGSSDLEKTLEKF